MSLAWRRRNESCDVIPTGPGCHRCNQVRHALGLANGVALAVVIIGRFGVVNDFNV